MGSRIFQKNTSTWGVRRMMSAFQRLLVVFVCLANGDVLIPFVDAEIANRTITSGCPTFTEIPVAKIHPGKPEEDFFFAGRYYVELGNDIPALGCKGFGEDIAAGAEWEQGMWSFGSILVNPGCTWYFFEKYNFKGKFVEYYGGSQGLLVSKVPTPSWAEGICYPSDNFPQGVACFQSVLYTCEQRFPNCAPAEDWEEVTCLDNTALDVTSPMTFKQIIGTKWSSEVEVSMSVSNRVEASISENFFDIFEASIGVSVETGFNWGRVNTQEKSEAKEYIIGPIPVPGGSIVCIEAVVGKCGASTVQTHRYRTVAGDKTREVLTLG